MVFCYYTLTLGVVKISMKNFNFQVFIFLLSNFSINDENVSLLVLNNAKSLLKFTDLLAATGFQDENKFHSFG